MELVSTDVLVTFVSVCLQSIVQGGLTSAPMASVMYVRWGRIRIPRLLYLVSTAHQLPPLYITEPSISVSATVRCYV